MKRLILLFGVMCGSMASIFVRYSTAPSIVLVVYRMFFVGMLLAPTAWKNRKEFRSMSAKTMLLCACSGMAFALHLSTSFEAVKNTSITSASVLINMEVLFVALATVLVFRRRIPGKALAAILLAFTGAVIVALADADGGAQANALWGDVLALLSAMLMGTYTMIGSICRKTVSTTAYTYLVYCTALITVLIITLVSGTPLVGYGSVNFVTAFGMAIVCTLMGHSVFSWCLKYLPASFVSTTRLTDCVFATSWGWLFFSEYPSATAVFGGIVVVLGVFLYSRIELLK